MTELPTGTVTFIFTDLEGSTRLWEQHPQTMQTALARHDEILRDAVESGGGRVVKTTGDGVHAVFATARDAVAAAAAGQRRLSAEPWPGPPLRVRVGIHTGEAERRGDDYFGPTLNRAARLMAAANGGQIVVSHATEEVLRDALPDGLGLIDLGEHRLRDLSRPERLFQLVGDGLEATFERLQSLDAFPTNLPLQLSSFVGRAEELDDLLAALGSTRVVTLTGVGGVGKTRLALQVAAQALPRYRDGAWLIELGPVEEADAVVEVTAGTLGIQQRPGRSLAESIVEALRGKDMLVVLDNCEHVLDPSAALVESLVRACPDVVVLATSREALDVAGERAKRVRSFPVPSTVAADLDAIALNDAVRLFVDRAQEVRAEFALEPGTVAPVAQICERLDGIPLAIELAAARVASMQPADIASRLDERFRLLTGGRRTAVERHHTLRATVDWSYDLLSAAEQSSFDRLGVFAGGFTLQAAERVIADDAMPARDVLDRLDALVARSMVALDESSPTTRYELLETMRQYARDRLEEREADVWRRRHAAYYADFAESCGERLHGPDEAVALANVGREIDNLRAAFVWSLDSTRPGDVAFALRIVAALAQEANAHQHRGIGAWAMRASSRADEASPGQRMAVLGAAAVFAVQSDPPLARRLATDAVAQGIPRDCPWPYIPYMALGLADMYEGNPDRAYDTLCQARRDIEAAGTDPFTEAALTVLATAFAASKGDFGAARRESERGVALAHATGSPSSVASAEAMLGWTLVVHDPPRALAALDEAVRLIRAGANDSAYPFTLALSAVLRARTGDARGAIRDLRDAVSFSHQNGTTANTAGTLWMGIEVAAEVGLAEFGAVLAGAVGDGVFKAVNFNPLTSGQDRNAALNVIRSALGDAAFEAAYRQGTQLSEDEAVAYVVEETGRVTPFN